MSQAGTYGSGGGGGGGGGGVTAWIVVTAATQAIAPNFGYIANRGTQITFTLPAVAAIGTVFRICGEGVGGYTIAQNAGQTLFFGTASTTTGVGGSLAAADYGDAIEVLCITANTNFRVLSSVGNFSIT